MKNKYSNAKKVKIENFEVGDAVTVRVPHEDRGKGGGTGGARGALAPPLFTDHLKIINYSDTQNGS